MQRSASGSGKASTHLIKCPHCSALVVKLGTKKDRFGNVKQRYQCRNYHYFYDRYSGYGYSEEFKKEVIKDILINKLTNTEASKKHKIHRQTLAKWIIEHNTGIKRKCRSRQNKSTKLDI